MNGAERICATLRELGADTVFGLPGTQNVVLYDAMRRSGLRSVAAADEGGAAFMAAGHARARGSVGIVTTIPGPGFVYALPGIAEAREDSVPLLWLTLRQPPDGQAFPLQRIDQRAMAAPVVKRCFLIERADQLVDGLIAAHAEAVADEPGPVLVEVAATLLLEPAPAGCGANPPVAPRWTAPPSLIERLRSAERPVIFAGQGAQGAAPQLQQLARQWNAPVLFTSSGRGALADADPLAFVHDFSFGVGEALPALLDRADLIVVLGCKFTHNGSAGGRLRLPEAKLVRVDASQAVLSANYPASVKICARVEDILSTLLLDGIAASRWTEQELGEIRARFQHEHAQPIEYEPAVGVEGTAVSMANVFDAMGRAFGAGVIYTADAGLHQALARRYARVASPRGLLCPNDFQSMGFGLPGAIGAALARPDDTVVACVGDGALALSLGEMLTAVREAVDLVVMVFNDGAYGLIRRQQLLTFGHPEGTSLQRLDYRSLAQALGCSYFPLTSDLAGVLSIVAKTPGVRLVELCVEDVPSLDREALTSAVREKVARALPSTFLELLKRALRR